MKEANVLPLSLSLPLPLPSGMGEVVLRKASCSHFNWCYVFLLQMGKDISKKISESSVPKKLN